MTACSMGLSVLTVLFLAMTREAYAIVVAFLLFVIKMALIWMSKSIEIPLRMGESCEGDFVFLYKV